MSITHCRTDFITIVRTSWKKSPVQFLHILMNVFKAKKMDVLLMTYHILTSWIRENWHLLLCGKNRPDNFFCNSRQNTTGSQMFTKVINWKLPINLLHIYTQAIIIINERNWLAKLLCNIVFQFMHLFSIPSNLLWTMCIELFETYIYEIIPYING